jgi:hypothetical protein
MKSCICRVPTRSDAVGSPQTDPLHDRRGRPDQTRPARTSLRIRRSVARARGEPDRMVAERTHPKGCGLSTPSDLHSGCLASTPTDAAECFASKGVREGATRTDQIRPHEAQLATQRPSPGTVTPASRTIWQAAVRSRVPSRGHLGSTLFRWVHPRGRPGHPVQLRSPTVARLVFGTQRSCHIRARWAERPGCLAVTGGQSGPAYVGATSPSTAGGRVIDLWSWLSRAAGQADLAPGGSLTETVATWRLHVDPTTGVRSLTVGRAAFELWARRLLRDAFDLPD